MARFVKAFVGKGRIVIYLDENGKRFEYRGGDPNWRNNNPGNLYADKVSHRHGQIGKDGDFAIFPDYDSGHDALIDCLQTTYGNRDLPYTMLKFAPADKNPNIKRYIRDLLKKTSVKEDKKIKDFTPTEFKKLWQGIEFWEGHLKGTISELPSPKQITRVRKDKKGVITDYFAEGLGWVSKSEAVELTKQEKIDAVVTTSRDGNLYLRARPGNPARRLQGFI